MKNFIFQNPTKLIFGKGMIASLANEIPADKRIMITFGGGSVKANGVYTQVTEALKNHNTIEFWGIEPNPSIETLRKAVELGKMEKVDYLLAVGGGSVIDGTKLIAAGLLYDGDAWDLVLNSKLIAGAVPFATVLTLPATGSEMNSGAVISCKTTKEKYAFGYAFPVFSILDPEVTFSLPPRQVACGIADTFVHVVEQYMTVVGQSRLMDRWAEGILQTLVEIAPKIKENQTNYDLMADFMLSATMALNGFIAQGVSQDWATHMIGHELTALHGLTHGASLAIVYPGTLRVLKEKKGDKILQFGERVWGITEGSREQRIDSAIERTENFFRSLGLSTRLHEENIDNATIDEIERRFNERRMAYGENADVTGAVAKKILKSCLLSQPTGE
ncbi:iron-containing alcohol dehydrogenase [uncultured Bacteroides sp.]|uniref:iron-containing alcohol dehydrogenase n=1 Tax=uncultured Bacteroides sp. TaxID=162156 RepID=UPI002AA81823|nr:iron-containing alcohol dehydrogenase [uncultured Bacteroides sp.]